MPRPAALLGTLALDRTAAAPLQRQLYDALREAILAGRLAPRTRLPSSRQLARDLGAARNTVVGAFEQLVAEGYLEARVGDGTRVAAVLPETLLHVGARGGAASGRRARPRSCRARGEALIAACGGRRQIPPPRLPARSAGARRVPARAVGATAGPARAHACTRLARLRPSRRPPGPARGDRRASRAGAGRGVRPGPGHRRVGLAGGARSVLPPAAGSGRRGLDRGARLPGRARRADRCGRTAGAGARGRARHRRRGTGSRAAPPRVWRT